MTEFTIRPAEILDARPINILVAYARGNAYMNPEIDLDEEWRTALIAGMLQNDSVQRSADNIRAAQEEPGLHLYLVAEDEQGIAGTLHAEKQDVAYELDSLFVASDRRSQGLGSKLMGAYFEWTTKAEALPTELDVVIFNEGAIRFYRRHGFEIVESSETEYEGVPKITMRREAISKEEKT